MNKINSKLIIAIALSIYKLTKCLIIAIAICAFAVCVYYSVFYTAIGMFIGAVILDVAHNYQEVGRE